VKLRYHPQAQAEHRIAAALYEAHRPGLGDGFESETARAEKLIQATAQTWPLWPGLDLEVPVHRYLLKRFPYALPYLVHNQDVVVLAVAHTSREPGYWRNRIEDVDRRVPPARRGSRGGRPRR
jgi:hypothetical protein